MFTAPSPTSAPRTILGIDPGTNLLGYGVLRCSGRRLELVATGVIDLRRCHDVHTKLGRIYERVRGVIDSFRPDEMAIEAPFFGKNVQSMLKLGRAQGVAIAAAISRSLPVHEYAPMQIKQAITGSGSASKEQVAGMLSRLLAVDESSLPPFLDATDAIGAAYCHALQPRAAASLRGATQRSSSRSWSDFVKQHPERLATRDGK